MAKVNAFGAGVAGFLAWVSAIVAIYAWVPFILKFLVDVFALKLPFWASFGYGLMMFLLTEFIAIVCLILFGAVAWNTAKGKK